MPEPLFQKCSQCDVVTDKIALRLGQRKFCKACARRIESRQNQQSTTNKPMPRPKSNDWHKVSQVLTRIEQEGYLPMPPMVQICKEAGVHENFISTSEDLRDRYREIRQRLKPRTPAAQEAELAQRIRDAQQPDQEFDEAIAQFNELADTAEEQLQQPTVREQVAQHIEALCNAPDPEVEALRQQLEEVRRQNAALKAELEAQPVTELSGDGRDAAIAHVRADIARWEAELEQMEQQQSTLAHNLRAAHQYLAALTGAEVATPDNSRNGKAVGVRHE